MKTLRILGIRGLPASHGGFETFAEFLSLYLVSKGWQVIVYSQHEGPHQIHQDVWQGVERVNIQVPGNGAKSTIDFDWRSIRHAAQHKDLCLTLGYNTAIFNTYLKLKRIPNVINMDGIEWKRGKWGGLAKTWFWLNDWIGCWVGDHLIADNPGIEAHLQTRVRADKITMIPYGAPSIAAASSAPVEALGLTPKTYLSLIARPEPENSILEIVQAFSAKPRGHSLVILGNYLEHDAYHRAVKAVASPEVKFLGAIYDAKVVQALRFHSLAYVHGHQVGGTNPSLVEAMGAGNAILAHDNPFNRWVAGEEASYFSNAEDLSNILDHLMSDPQLLQASGQAAHSRFLSNLTWPIVLSAYEELLTRYLPNASVKQISS